MEIARYLIAFVAVFNFGGLVADAIVPATARQPSFSLSKPARAMTTRFRAALPVGSSQNGRRRIRAAKWWIAT